MNDTVVPGRAAEAVRDWLIEEAGFLEHFGLVLDGLCERLLAAGLPLARATSHIRVVHSERIGLSRVWRRGQATIEQHFGFGPEVDAMYQRSPIRVAHEAKRRFELRPGDPSAEPFGITADLKAAGISHYVIFPLFFTGGHVNAASFATDRAGGFRAAEIEFIERLLPALSRVMEIKGLQRSRQELLRIYVGKLPAERILDGHIRRGNVVAMDAAILLCDLRGSTQMAVELDEEAFVLAAQPLFRLRRAGGDGPRRRGAEVHRRRSAGHFRTARASRRLLALRSRALGGGRDLRQPARAQRSREPAGRSQGRTPECAARR